MCSLLVDSHRLSARMQGCSLFIVELCVCGAGCCVLDSLRRLLKRNEVSDSERPAALPVGDVHCLLPFERIIAERKCV